MSEPVKVAREIPCDCPICSRVRREREVRQEINKLAEERDRLRTALADANRTIIDQANRILGLETKLAGPCIPSACWTGPCFPSGVEIRLTF